MAITNFIPEIWEARIERYVRQGTVFEGIINRNYEGEITGTESVVRVNTVGGVTINDYEKDSDIVLEELQTAGDEMRIDTKKYWGAKTSDVDSAQINISMLDEAASDAGYKIALLQDTYILSKYADASLTYGTTASPIDVTTANIFAFFARITRLFDEADLPEQNRWMVIPPWLVEKMVLTKIIAATDNTAVIDNGKVANFMGWDLRRSNRIQKVDTTKYKLMAGIGTIPISFASALLKTEAFRPEKRFEDAIKGLTVYGGKVMRPDYLMCITATEGTEAS
jgi:hypothetical protein